MMIAVRNFAVVTILLLLCRAVAVVRAQESPTPMMSICQARTTLTTELQTVMTGDRIGLPRHAPSEIRINADKIEFYGWACCGTGKHYVEQSQVISLKELTPFAVHFFNDTATYKHLTPGWELILDGHALSATEWSLSTLKWSSETDARAFANALNRLIAYARTYDPAKPRFAIPCEEAAQEAFWKEFHQKAATWQAQSPKPPLSDEVRQHRLLAEDALKQKHMDIAISEYEAGLGTDPLWPQGHFNAALLYGEQKDYEDAIWHMRAYLELVPDAPDAQAARDQLLLWQGKLKQEETAGPK
jgi:tetratricopeptide (TPR) repeat protein